MNCTATSGFFKLTFRQKQTRNIAFNASTTAVDVALEELATIGNVSVSFSNGGTKACTRGSIMQVTFLTELGDLPPLRTTNNYAVTEVQKGTKLNVECNGRGTCNRQTGVCDCLDGWGSSDGENNRGTRGDCGFKDPYASWTSEYWDGLYSESPPVASSG